jgi:hypothetical protein
MNTVHAPLSPIGRVVRPDSLAVGFRTDLAFDLFHMSKRQSEHSGYACKDPPGVITVAAGLLGALMITIFQDYPSVFQLVDENIAIQFK